MVRKKILVVDDGEKNISIGAKMKILAVDDIKPNRHLLRKTDFQLISWKPNDISAQSIRLES